jgi:uncharacterized protein (DUF488 family)
LQTIWTIGHSTHAIQDFMELLTGNGITTLADVRRFPGSRKHPHFGQDALRASLSGIGIEYVHFLELGGRRVPRPDSANTAWRNESFRGYADYMACEEFGRGIRKLSNLAERRPTAVMCSEALWWRCHRAMIADLLKSEGWQVLHILKAGTNEAHPFTSAATIRDGKLSYAGNTDRLAF